MGETNIVSSMGVKRFWYYDDDLLLVQLVVMQGVKGQT